MSKAPPPYEGQFNTSPVYPPGPGMPPPGAYVQQPGPTTNVVVIDNSAKCPGCGQMRGAAVIKREANIKTHLFAFLCCIFGCPCLFWVPYCTDSCLAYNSYCPNCGALLATMD